MHILTYLCQYSTVSVPVPYLVDRQCRWFSDTRGVRNFALLVIYVIYSWQWFCFTCNLGFHVMSVLSLICWWLDYCDLTTSQDVHFSVVPRWLSCKHVYPVRICVCYLSYLGILAWVSTGRSIGWFRFVHCATSLSVSCLQVMLCRSVGMWCCPLFVPHASNTSVYLIEELSAVQMQGNIHNWTANFQFRCAHSFHFKRFRFTVF